MRIHLPSRIVCLLLLAVAGTAQAQELTDIQKVQSRVSTDLAALRNNDEYQLTGKNASKELISGPDHIERMEAGKEGKPTVTIKGAPYLIDTQVIVVHWAGVHDAAARLRIATDIISLVRVRLREIGDNGQVTALDPLVTLIDQGAAALMLIKIDQAIKHGKPALANRDLLDKNTGSLKELKALIERLQVQESTAALTSYRKAIDTTKEALGNDSFKAAIEELEKAGMILNGFLNQTDRDFVGLTAREGDIREAARHLQGLDLSLATFDTAKLDLFQFMGQRKKLKTQQDLLKKNLPALFDASALEARWRGKVDDALARTRTVDQALAPIHTQLHKAAMELDQLPDIKLRADSAADLTKSIQATLDREAEYVAGLRSALQSDDDVVLARQMLARTLTELRQRFVIVVRDRRIAVWTLAAQTGIVVAAAAYRDAVNELETQGHRSAASLVPSVQLHLQTLAKLQPEPDLVQVLKASDGFSALDAGLTSASERATVLLGVLQEIAKVPALESQINATEVSLEGLRQTNRAIVQVAQRLSSVEEELLAATESTRVHLVTLSKRGNYAEANLLRRTVLERIEAHLATGEVDNAKAAYATLDEVIRRVEESARLASEVPPADLTEGVDALQQRVAKAVHDYRIAHGWFEPWPGAGLVSPEDRNVRSYVIEQAIAAGRLDEAEVKIAEAQATARSDEWRLRLKELAASVLVLRARAAEEDGDMTEARSRYAQAEALSQGPSQHVARQALAVMRARSLAAAPSSKELGMVTVTAGVLALPVVLVLVRRIVRRRRVARLQARLQETQRLARQGRVDDAAREARRILAAAVSVAGMTEGVDILAEATRFVNASITSVPLPDGLGKADHVGVRHLINNPRPSLVELRRVAQWLRQSAGEKDHALVNDAIRWLAAGVLARVTLAEADDCLAWLQQAADGARRGELCLCIAAVALRFGRFADAERGCVQGLSLSPPVPVQNELLISLVRALIELDRPQEAVAALKSAIKKRPEPALRKWLAIATGYALRSGRIRNKAKSFGLTTGSLSRAVG